MKTDVSKAEEVKKMIAATVNRYGRLDILANIAGIVATEDSVVDCTEETFMKVINVKLVSVWLGMKYAIPEIEKAGGAAIANFTSIAALEAYKGIPACAPSASGSACGCWSSCASGSSPSSSPGSDPLHRRHHGAPVRRRGDHQPRKLAELVKVICSRYRLPYLTITPTFSICPNHGYLRPVNQWNEGKVEMFKQRKTFKIAQGVQRTA